MSGLTQRNQAGQSGLVAPKVDFQRFDTAGSTTWTKPGDVSIVWIECIGGGGGGGAGQSGAATAEGGGGGGGGAFSWACFSANALPSTLDVIVGGSGSGGAGASTANNGSAGGNSQVDIPDGGDEDGKVILIAYGGGGGGA